MGHSVTLASMPTTKQRHIVTETAEIAEAIDIGAAMYPGVSRADILRKLVIAGAGAVAAQSQRRRDVVERHAGRHTGMYPAGYLDQLRDEWPS